MTFPINPFEDIQAKSFSKHNKKQVTEDFVEENLKECGWQTHHPFNDTGIDIIAYKKVCPKNHIEFSEKTIGKTKCDICESDLILIKRFVQVKTREVKGDEARTQFFGYTLKSKDFRTDPRHVFWLYSDTTNEFLIIPMYDYLKIFHKKDIGKSHFSTPSFRKGNNKMNSLRKDANGEWKWKGNSFMAFHNEIGMKNMSNPDFDLRLDWYVSEVRQMKFDLFYNYSAGNQTDAKTEIKIRDWINKQVSLNLSEVQRNLRTIAKNRQETSKNLKQILATGLTESINGYFQKFRGIKF